MHWLGDSDIAYTGTLQVAETYYLGVENNKHESKKLKAGRGGVGKTAVVGMKDRRIRQGKTKVIGDTKCVTLHEFVREGAPPGSTVHSDDFVSYHKLDESMGQKAKPDSRPRSEQISKDVNRRAERIASRLMSTPRIKNRDAKATKTALEF